MQPQPNLQQKKHCPADSQTKEFTTKVAPSDMELGHELVHGVLKKEMEDVHVDESPEAIRLQRFREWLLVKFSMYLTFFLSAGSEEPHCHTFLVLSEDGFCGLGMKA